LGVGGWGLGVTIFVDFHSKNREISTWVDN
jgi:hypothetical protein